MWTPTDEKADMWLSFGLCLGGICLLLQLIILIMRRYCDKNKGIGSFRGFLWLGFTTMNVILVVCVFPSCLYHGMIATLPNWKVMLLPLMIALIFLVNQEEDEILQYFLRSVEL